MISQNGEPTERAEGFKPTPRQIIGAIVAVVLIVFIAGNNDDVSVSLIVTEATLPLWLVLAVTALLGVGIGMLLGTRRTKAKLARRA